MGRASNSVCDISGKEDTGIAGLLRCDRRDADFSKRRRRTVVFIVPSERGIAGLVARLAHDRHEIEHDRTLGQAFLELLGVKSDPFAFASSGVSPSSPASGINLYLTRVRSPAALVKVKP